MRCHMQGATALSEVPHLPAPCREFSLHASTSTNALQILSQHNFFYQDNPGNSFSGRQGNPKITEFILQRSFAGLVMLDYWWTIVTWSRQEGKSSLASTDHYISILPYKNRSFQERSFFSGQAMHYLIWNDCWKQFFRPAIVLLRWHVQSHHHTPRRFKEQHTRHQCFFPPVQWEVRGALENFNSNWSGCCGAGASSLVPCNQSLEVAKAFGDNRTLCLRSS